MHVEAEIRARLRSRRAPHSKRPQFRGLSHVIYRLRDGMPELRKPKVLRVLEGVFRAARSKEGFRLIAYSIQNTHLYLVVEGDSAAELSRGMQGLGVRITRQLNKLWRRRGHGSVFRERFKQIVVSGYKHIRAVLRYVLNNALRHGSKRADGTPDRYSSMPWYRVWVSYRRPLRESPVAQPRYVWAACGGGWPFIDVDDRPGYGPQA